MAYERRASLYFTGAHAKGFYSPGHLNSRGQVWLQILQLCLVSPGYNIIQFKVRASNHLSQLVLILSLSDKVLWLAF